MLARIGAALALAALLGAAQAAAHEMQVLQGGENFEVQWTGGPRDNVVGGGSGRIVGGGQDQGVTYAPGSVFGQPGHAAMSGGGEDRTITHRVPQPPAVMLAQPGPRRR